MPENFPPKVYLIGAQKSGTTTLATFLDRHPDILVSTPKEPDFFTRFHSKGYDWYSSCFSGMGSETLVDASTSYSMAPLAETESATNPLCGVPKRIFDSRPDAKFIYLLRDPVSRTYSAYWHAVRAGEERRPLLDALGKNSTYVRGSLYSAQIENYTRFFDPERFLFLDFRVLSRDPGDIVNQCLAFLDLPPFEAEMRFDDRKNASFDYNAVGHLAQRALGGASTLKTVSRRVQQILPDGAVRVLKNMISRPVPAMSPEQRAALEDIFHDEIARTKTLTGIDLGASN